MGIRASLLDAHDLHNPPHLDEQTGSDTVAINTHRERDDASSASTFYLDPNLIRFEELLKRLERLVENWEEQLNG